MRNELLIESPDSYRLPFTVFVVSLFLQTHTTEQLAVFMQRRNQAMSHFINSIKRKLPDRIDIFNKKNETEFVALMKGDFKRIISEELAALENFLPKEIARNTINDNFNYTEEDGSEFGNISLSNLQYLIKQCFFPDWGPMMEDVYKTFVKEQVEVVEESTVEERKDDDGNLSEAGHQLETNKMTYVHEATNEGKSGRKGLNFAFQREES
jgi:hypothetical protein